MSIKIIPNTINVLVNKLKPGIISTVSTNPAAIYNTLPLSSIREEYHYDTKLSMSSLPIDTEVFKDEEKTISMKAEIIKTIEWNRANTETAIAETQKSFIPTFLNIEWHKTNQYFKNRKYAVLRSYTKVGISIDRIYNNRNFQDRNIRVFNLEMDIAVNKQYVHPFLLFINGYQINWSRIEIVKSDDFIYLIISNMDCDTAIQTLDILFIPFDVYYLEKHDELINRDYIFKFTEDGGATGSCSTFVYPLDNRVRMTTLSEKEYRKYDIDIPYTVKLNRDNFFFFTQEGKLLRNIKDEDLKIENGNILTLLKGSTANIWGMCIYSSLSNTNKANIVHALNEPFTKDLVREKVGFSELNEGLFTEGFDFTHSRDLPYNTNISNSIDYVFHYNVNELDSVYMKARPVNIIELNAEELEKRYRKNGYIEMQRDIYPNDKTTSFPIIFQNGMIPTYYDKIEYYSNKFRFKLYDDYYSIDGIYGKSTFEVAYYRGVNNDLIKLNQARIYDKEYLNLNNCNIDKNDIVIYAEIDNKMYPIPMDIDISGYGKLHNSKYLNNQLYIGSKNQFIYERYNIKERTTFINLSSKFKTGYDQQKYLVFINGRYLNRIYYHTLIPSLNNDKITRLSIYTMNVLIPGDRVDVFYCSAPKQTPVNYNGDLILKCNKVKAYNNNQKRFKVPYPFKNYPHIYDAFFCFKHGVYVDKNKYIIDGDYIEFIDDDDALDFARDLVFVFPYYMQGWDDEDNILEDADVNFITRQTRISRTSATVAFTPDYLGNVINKDSIYIFFNTTFIARDRYNVTSNNTIEMVNETIPADTMITMIIETDRTSTVQNNVVLDVVESVATENQQYLFPIPEQEYYDSFFVIKGSVILSPERYFVSPDGNLFITTEGDYVPKGDKLLFIFAKDKNMESDPNYMYKIKTGFMHYRCTESTDSITIPTNFYHNFEFNKDNLLIFANSVFISADRYTIKKNGIYMTLKTDVILRKGSSIDIVYAYTALNADRFIGEINNREIIYTQDKYTDVYYDGQNKVAIPYPLLPMTDTEFMVSKGSSVLLPDMYSYTKGDSWLYLKDSANLQKGDQIRFTFFHNRGFTHIGKAVYSVTLSKGQQYVVIPAPYYRQLNLRNRIIVTLGNEYIDQSRYMIDNKARVLYLLDIPSYSNEDGRKLTVYFFYTGRESNTAIAYLPQSGYVCFMRREIDRNYNKEMYLMFINGRKVAKSQILDITNNLLKVKIDIDRRYDLIVLNASPSITELKDKYSSKFDKWSQMIDPLPI